MSRHYALILGFVFLSLTLLFILFVSPSLAGRSFSDSVSFQVNEEKDAENKKTLSISSKKGWNQAKAVVSLAENNSDNQLHQFVAGDNIRAMSEVEVSVTCTEPTSKCIGNIYRYSPQVKGKLILAKSQTSKRGEQIGDVHKIKCSQSYPNRNHHCLLVFDESDVVAKNCLCTLNLVLQANHKKAKRGEKLVIGTDTSSGVKGGKANISAAYFDQDPSLYLVERYQSTRRLTRQFTIANKESSSTRQATASVAVGTLRKGDVLIVRSDSVTGIRHLGYNVLHQGELVLAEKPGTDDNSGIAVLASSKNGKISNQNGANCTRGKSYLSDPCLITKVGVLGMELNGVQKPNNDKGSYVPMYVNLTTAYSAVYGDDHQQKDRVRLKSVDLVVEKYRPYRSVR